MSVVPVIASAEDLPSAIVYAQRKPTARWYVAKRCIALAHADLIPVGWGEGVDALRADASFLPSKKARKKAAGKGHAIPNEDSGGSFPIRNREELKKAIQAYGRSKPADRAKVRAHIIKRARALKAPYLIPKDWIKKTPAVSASARRLPRSQSMRYTGPMDKMTAAAGWDPNLHPRDRGGQFISVGDILEIFSGQGFDTPLYQGKVTGSHKMSGDRVRLTVQVTNAGTSGLDEGVSVEVNPDHVRVAPEVKARLDTPGKSATKETSELESGDIVETPDGPKEVRFTEDDEEGGFNVHFDDETEEPNANTQDQWKILPAGTKTTSDTDPNDTAEEALLGELDDQGVYPGDYDPATFDDAVSKAIKNYPDDTKMQARMVAGQLDYEGTAVEDRSNLAVDPYSTPEYLDWEGKAYSYAEENGIDLSDLGDSTSLRDAYDSDTDPETAIDEMVADGEISEPDTEPDTAEAFGLSDLEDDTGSEATASRLTDEAHKAGLPGVTEAASQAYLDTLGPDSNPDLSDTDVVDELSDQLLAQTIVTESGDWTPADYIKFYDDNMVAQFPEAKAMVENDLDVRFETNLRTARSEQVRDELANATSTDRLKEGDVIETPDGDRTITHILPDGNGEYTLALDGGTAIPHVRAAEPWTVKRPTVIMNKPDPVSPDRRTQSQSQSVEELQRQASDPNFREVDRQAARDELDRRGETWTALESPARAAARDMAVAKDEAQGTRSTEARAAAQDKIHESAKRRGLSTTDYQMRLDAILNSDDPVQAHKDLAKIATEMKLGGRQRKQFRELLDQHFGVEGDDGKSSAADTAANLRADNPVRERLTAKVIRDDLKAHAATDVKAPDLEHIFTVPTPAPPALVQKAKTLKPRVKKTDSPLGDDVMLGDVKLGTIRRNTGANVSEGSSGGNVTYSKDRRPWKAQGPGQSRTESFRTRQEAIGWLEVKSSEFNARPLEPNPKAKDVSAAPTTMREFQDAESRRRRGLEQAMAQGDAAGITEARAKLAQARDATDAALKAQASKDNPEAARRELAATFKKGEPVLMHGDPSDQRTVVGPSRGGNVTVMEMEHSTTVDVNPKDLSRPQKATEPALPTPEASQAPTRRPATRLPGGAEAVLPERPTVPLGFEAQRAAEFKAKYADSPKATLVKRYQSLHKARTKVESIRDYSTSPIASQAEVKRRSKANAMLAEQDAIRKILREKHGAELDYDGNETRSKTLTEYADQMYNFRTGEINKDLPPGVTKKSVEPPNLAAKASKYRSKASKATEIGVDGKPIGVILAGQVGGREMSGRIQVGWRSESTGWLAFDEKGKEVRGVGLTAQNQTEAISLLLKNADKPTGSPEFANATVADLFGQARDALRNDDRSKYDQIMQELRSRGGGVYDDYKRAEARFPLRPGAAGKA